MEDKRKIFLLIYGIIILAGLVYILFIAPNDLFLSKETKKFIKEVEKYNEENSNDISGLLKHLDYKEYDYSYNILDSVGKDSVIYKCRGTIRQDKDSGACTEPKEIVYDETNKKDKLSSLNHDLLNIDYLKELIKEKTPTVEEYDSLKQYKYEVEIDTLKTDIIFYANKYDIEQIQIMNGYETYVIKLSNINY